MMHGTFYVEYNLVIEKVIFKKVGEFSSYC